MPIHNSRKTLIALAALAILAWLPSPARAQFSLTLAPAPVTGLPGDTGLKVFGSLANLANAPVDFVTEDFSLISGPSGADLTTAISFSADNLVNFPIPLTLAANQLYPGPTGADFAPLLFLDADAAAPLGTYSGNFTVTYGGQTVGQDFTINLGSTQAVPEAGTLPILVLGVGYIFYAARRRAACRR